LALFKSYYKYLKQLSTKTYSPHHNPIKSDVFTLGVILLHAATLESNENFYNFKNYQINPEIVN